MTSIKHWPHDLSKNPNRDNEKQVLFNERSTNDVMSMPNLKY